MKLKIIIFNLLLFGMFSEVSASSSITRILTGKVSLDTSLGCKNLLSKLDSVDLQSKILGLTNEELRIAFNCAVQENAHYKVEILFKTLNKRGLSSSKSWKALITYYTKNSLHIEELLAIEEARKIYPFDSELLLIEINYHITNKTVPYYTRKIESKISGGDVRYYAVNAALNLHLGLRQTNLDHKIKYFVYARQDLKKMRQINPNSQFSNLLLATVNDSLDEVLLDRIEQTDDRKVFDSLFEMELAYFLDYMDVVSEKTSEKRLIQYQDILFNVKSWVRDTVYFEIRNKSKRNTNIRYKSTPHCVLIGSNSIQANTNESYLLCVQPSASKSQFELTPTFFFSDYASSFSMSISGFVIEAENEKELLFETVIPDLAKTFRLNILDSKNGNTIYHAETSVSKGSVTKSLAPGIFVVKGELGTYKLNVAADGYLSSVQNVNINQDNQLVTVYLKPKPEKELSNNVDFHLDTSKNLNIKSDVDPLAKVEAQHIVIVLDVSQSMKRNGHFENIKTELIDLVRQLRPIDTISILSFASSKTVIADHISASMKDSLMRLIANIQVRGGTNAKVALRSSFALVKKYNSPSTTNVLFLITDGKLTAPSTPSSWYESYLLKYFRPLKLKLNMVLYSTAPSDFTYLEYLSNLTGGVTRPGINHDLSKTCIDSMVNE